MIVQALVILLLCHYADSEEPAQFYLTVRNRPGVQTRVTAETLAAHISFRVPLIMIIHGWTESWKADHYVEMTTAYVNQGKNVIAIDWQNLGGSDYLEAVEATETVGKYSGEFLSVLYRKGLDLTKVHAVGHSLGAHVAGFMGKTVYKRTSKKVGRITGLDPAGLGFYKFVLFDDRSKRLDEKDAKLVVVLNTDMLFGVWRSLGKITFYANDGIIQPGCPFDGEPDPTAMLFCNHHKSYAYMIESLTSNRFVGRTECEWFEFWCETKSLIFNENIPLSSEEEIYYFYTNSKKPYGRG